MVVTIPVIISSRRLRRKDAPFRHRDIFLVTGTFLVTIIIPTYDHLDNKPAIQQIQRIEEGMREEDVQCQKELTR